MFVFSSQNVFGLFFIREHIIEPGSLGMEPRGALKVKIGLAQQLDPGGHPKERMVKRIPSHQD